MDFPTVTKPEARDQAAQDIIKHAHKIIELARTAGDGDARRLGKLLLLCDEIEGIAVHIGADCRSEIARRERRISGMKDPTEGAK